MPMFRKKPVTIEAREFGGIAAEVREVCGWIERDNVTTLEDSPEGLALKAEYGLRDGLTVAIDPATGALVIPTLEGLMRATLGDWIIRGIKGEFYPCKPDIFAATYEPA